MTTPACDDVDIDNPLAPPSNILHSALACNQSNPIAGADPGFKFADSVHPTPFASLLLAKYVSAKMQGRGWL